MPFYSPEFVIDAILVSQKHGMSVPTDIASPVFVKVCEACGSIVVLEDVHDRWHYEIAKGNHTPPTARERKRKEIR